MNLLKQSFVKYGLIMTLVLVVCLVLMEVTGNNETFDSKSPIFLIYQYLAPAVIWYFGMTAKKKQLGGKLTYKQGLIEGFKMSLVFGIVSPFVFAFYYLVINPAILEYIKVTYQMPDTSDSAIIGVDMLTQFIAAIIGGTLYAAVIALFVRTKSSKNKS